MVRFHFENNSNFTTLQHICQEGGAKNVEKHKRGKVSSEKTLDWQKMRDEWEYLPLLL